MAQNKKKWHKNGTFLVYNFCKGRGKLYTYPQSIIRLPLPLFIFPLKISQMKSYTFSI
jgi:hypothetical protein